MDFHRVVQIFESNAVFFARPSLWDDPYEVRLRHKRSDALFAQCWCQTAMSDAMWRIYSPGGLGVRVGTTKKKLLAAVDAWTRANGYNHREGEVEYFSTSDLNRRSLSLQKDLQKQYDPYRAADSLFGKREAFAHEDEWRAVIYRKGEDESAKGLSVPVKPHELINSLLLDPRAPKEVVDALAFFLRERLKFAGKVRPSALYKTPHSIVVK